MLSEWIEWKGGDRPVGASVPVKAQLRCEGREEAEFDKAIPASEYDWEHGMGSADIIAYRVVAPANDNTPKLETPAQSRAYAINDLVRYFHGKSTANGWWSDSDKANPLVAPAKLMLIVSEIAEAMEGHRKNLQDDKLPHRKMIEVELGDALIRICDLAGHLGLDLGGATMEKDAYNDVRADHKLEARAAAGGKAY